jgi:hypothetical protein
MRNCQSHCRKVEKVLGLNVLAAEQIDTSGNLIHEERKLGELESTRLMGLKDNSPLAMLALSTRRTGTEAVPHTSTCRYLRIVRSSKVSACRIVVLATW